MQARCAGVAQSVEQFTRNEKVGGSIPLSGTNNPFCDVFFILSTPNSIGEKALLDFYSQPHSKARSCG